MTAMVVDPDRIVCPHCSRVVAINWLPNSEFVARCYFPCRMLFAIRTSGFTAKSAKIDWDSGKLCVRRDAPISSVVSEPDFSLDDLEWSEEFQ